MDPRRIPPKPLLVTTLTLLVALPAVAGPSAKLPWREAGLSERQAAAHLLDRFAFGARPGDVDRVVEMGLAAWLEQQLQGGLPDDEVARRLADFHSLGLSPRELAETYVSRGVVLREAQRAGAVSRDEMARPEDGSGKDAARADRLDGAGRREIMSYARDQGYRPLRELVGETMAQKLYRALYSENQLSEVLADFWFNHFNVSITDNQSRSHLLGYERDAIRPYVLGSFREMLEATAKHPAMLHYLDNARSVAEEGARTTFDLDRARGRGRSGGRNTGGIFGIDPEMRRQIEQRRPQGLNENYARELMELHTLGVDGGYSQQDVVEVARAFTGWTAYPPGQARRQVERRIQRARRFPEAGYVFEELFFFRADAHDAGKKTILGQAYPAGRGIEDGLQVLDTLAAHPSTAHHLATKLAVRFVSDEPPERLIDRLAKSLAKSRGDLRQVMRTLAASPEFWSEEARRGKIKSPFELAVSALRTLDADVYQPRPTVEWIQRMGQPLYAYQAPTGYPDKAEFWVNTGSLLHRMSFGLQLATGRIGGVRFDLGDLNHQRQPESLSDALATYVPLLLPERDPTETLRQLEPVIHDPELARKIEQAAPVDRAEITDSFDEWDTDMLSEGGGRRRGRLQRARPTASQIDNGPVAQVVGVILGSPEFQRR